MAELPRPRYRPRRLRRTAAIRALVRETSVDTDRLVQPLFIREDPRMESAIPSMPGIFRLTMDEAASEAEQLAELGVPAVILFGLPAEKDSLGQGAYDENGVVQEAVRAVKRAAPDVIVMTDVCLCEYTDHGHCGVIRDGRIDNDGSLELLAKTAVSQARAGADLVAPSAMMDGQVGAIRAARERFDAPLAAYSVSGEYSLIKAAAERGWVDERSVVEETITAIRRAGADLILTYYAKDFARWRRERRA